MTIAASAEELVQAKPRIGHRDWTIGPDGALYISDDQHGRVWRVTYKGGTEVTRIEAAPTPSVATSTNLIGPPEGTHPEAGHEGTHHY